MMKRTLAWMPMLALIGVTATACTFFSSDESPPPTEEIISGAQNRLSSLSSVRGDATVSGPACESASIIMLWTDQPAVLLKLIGIVGGVLTEEESLTHSGTTYSRLGESDPWQQAPSELMPTEVNLPAFAQITNVTDVMAVDIGSATAYRLEGTAPGTAVGLAPSSVTVPEEVNKVLMVRGDTWDVIGTTSSFTTAEGDCRITWEFHEYNGVPRMNPPTVAAP